jgi:hypothetical protein
METKMYALLVISTKPINTKSIENQKEVQHLAQESFFVIPRDWGTSVIKPIPKKLGSGARVFDCRGRSVIEAVMERLREIFSENPKK